MYPISFKMARLLSKSLHPSLLSSFKSLMSALLPISVKVAPFLKKTLRSTLPSLAKISPVESQNHSVQVSSQLTLCRKLLDKLLWSGLPFPSKTSTANFVKSPATSLYRSSFRFRSIAQGSCHNWVFHCHVSKKLRQSMREWLCVSVEYNYW